MHYSGNFITTANSDPQTEATRITRSGSTVRELDADYEGCSRQRRAARVSTSTKLPVMNRVTPPLVSPLVDNGASLEEATPRNRKNWP